MITYDEMDAPMHRRRDLPGVFVIILNQDDERVLFRVLSGPHQGAYEKLTPARFIELYEVAIR